MKIRTGFVSNSSSSSFICCITGQEEIVYDTTHSEIGFAQCERGHEFLEKYLIKQEEMTTEQWLEVAVKYYVNIDYSIADKQEREKKNLADKQAFIKKERTEEEISILIEELKENWDTVTEWQSDVPSCICPICTFKEFDNNDIIKYLYRKIGTTKEEIKKEIAETFKNYDEFNNFLTKEV